MTEDEAKTKWCPHKKGQFPSETNCMASECMMWRGVGGLWVDSTGSKIPDEQFHPLETDKWVIVGDCGLARSL